VHLLQVVVMVVVVALALLLLLLLLLLAVVVLRPGAGRRLVPAAMRRVGPRRAQGCIAAGLASHVPPFAAAAAAVPVPAVAGAVLRLAAAMPVGWCGARTPSTRWR
jgi:hypothetical protein